MICLRVKGLYQIPTLINASLAMKLKKAQQHYLPGDAPIFRRTFSKHGPPVHLCSCLMTVK